MKPGDLVFGRWHSVSNGQDLVAEVGLIIEVINSERTVPPVCKVLWSSGEIDKEWTDDIEVANEQS